MTLKKKLLEKSRLYVILDKNLSRDKNPIKVFNKIKAKGVDIVQLRDRVSPKIEIFKLAQRLRYLSNKNKIIFIINDFVDIAKVVDADGLHIGQGDLDIKEARRILGRDKIIGVSCHNLKQLIVAQKKGADYIAIGPIFPTSVKPKTRPLGLDILKKISKRLLSTPVFAVGGINEFNLNMVLASGITRIAVSGAVCKAMNPSLAIKKLNSQLVRYKSLLSH